MGTTTTSRGEVNIARLVAFTFDTNIPDVLTRFWAHALRWNVREADGGDLELFGHALGWPLVWDQDEETAIQASDGTGPKITWSGPPLMPRSGAERIHFHLAPTTGASTPTTLDRLLALGATRASTDATCRGAIPLADVDGNHCCLVAP